jgi:hypothetical protein
VTKSSKIMSAPNPKGDQTTTPSLSEVLEVIHTMQHYDTRLQKVEEAGKVFRVTQHLMVEKLDDMYKPLHGSGRGVAAHFGLLARTLD